MDKQAWDKAKLEEWKKFWESEMGQEAIAKMQAIKENMLSNAMGQLNPDAIAACVGRAAGIDLILQDIEDGFIALGNAGKEDKKK